jgi:hypothetical protein
VHFRLIATAPDGSQALDERWVYVDNSAMAILPVEVVGENGQPLPNLPVYAETSLYEWRGRNVSTLSDSGGNASLHVEALSEVPTTYIVSLPPTVVEGFYYEGLQGVQVSLPPGAASVAPITLQASQQIGQISGILQGVQGSIPIWRIHLPDGDATAVATNPEGAFSFSKVPVDEYLLVSDPGALAAQGLALEPQTTDLIQDRQQDISLSPVELEGQTLSGTVAGAEEIALPFSWIQVENRRARLDPFSGTFTLYDLPEGPATAIVIAPGYYSQAHILDIGQQMSSSAEFRLVLRPDTRMLTWGSGAIAIPSETHAEVEGLDINFLQGWIWGRGEADSPLSIRWDDIHIRIPAGRFALERLPGQGAWLYMLDGEANIQRVDGSQAATVLAGEMVYLQTGLALKPVPYDPVVFVALHADEHISLAETWQPSPEALFRDRLAQVGISMAQVVTFITYLGIFVAVGLVPLVLLYRALKTKLGEPNPH